MLIKRGLSACLSCLLILLQPSPLQSRVAEAPNKDDVLVANLRSIYQSGAILLESYGACANKSAVITAPSMMWRSPHVSSDKMSRLRYSLGENQGLEVDKDSSGVVIIRAQGFSSKLMTVKIQHIEFEEDQRYSAELATGALLKAIPVEDAMNDLNMKSMPKFGGFISGAGPGQPKLAKVLDKETFEGILIAIVKKFQGIMIYEECSLKDGGKRFSYDYYYPQ